MLTFNYIDIEGFGAIVQPFHYPLNEPGITIYRAANGTGKTTIFSGLVWALFGINLKGTVQAKVVSYKSKRGSGFMGTRVMVGINVNGSDYVIARHIRFKGETLGYEGGDSLMVFQNGTLLIDDTGKDKGQVLINELLGMDERLFLNTVLFGQRMKKLISSSSDDKAKVFETMFDLDWLPKAKELAKKKLDEKKVEVAEIDSRVKVIQAKLDSKKEQIRYIESEISESTRKIETELEGIESSIQAITTTLGNKEAVQDTFQDLKEELSVCSAEVVTLYDEFTTCKADADKFRQEYDAANTEYTAITRELDQAKFEKESIEKELKSAQYLQETKTTRIKEVEGRIAKASEVFDTNKNSLLVSEEDLAKAEEILAGLPDQGRTEQEINSVILNHKLAKNTLIQGSLTIAKTIAELENQIKDFNTTVCPNCGAAPEHKNTDSVDGLHERVTNYLLKVADNARSEKTLDNYIEIETGNLEYVKKRSLAAEEVSKLSKEVGLLAKACTAAEAILYDLQVSKQKIETEEVDTTDEIKGRLKVAEDRLSKLTNLKEYNFSHTTDREEKLIMANQWVSKKTAQYNASKAKEADLRAKVDEMSLLVAVDEKVLIRDREKLQARKGELDIKLLALPLKTKKLNEELGELMAENNLVLEEFRVADEDMEHLKWWNGTAFSASGIKAQIFDAMLTNLNVHVDKYAGMVGMGIKFGVDLSKARKDFFVEVLYKGENVSYDELSGGEQQRVDIATVFACHEMLAAKTSINVLIMDEIFEGLDAEGRELVFTMLRQLIKPTMSYHVITHMDINSMYCKVKELTNTNGYLEVR